MGKRSQSDQPDESQPGSGAAERLTFEQALEQLEQIVGQLEDGQLGLNESLARYELGVKCLKQCYEQLKCAEQRIELVARVDADGEASGEPFGDEAASLEEKQAARSRRRSGSGRSPGGMTPDAAPGDPSALF
jgi:exodeoxyribonuclease VII small subunit